MGQGAIGIPDYQLRRKMAMGGAGFELAEAEPPDLQSGSFNHSEILPRNV